LVGFLRRWRRHGVDAVGHGEGCCWCEVMELSAALAD
jgi:hypothetical protein